MIVTPEVEEYVEAHTTPPPPHLAELAAETRASLESPQMLTGTVEGRFLETLVHFARPRRILEIGTYSGYSALAMASAMHPAGRLVSLELSAERAEFARRHIDLAGEGERVEVIVGPALESLESLPGPFDLVFVDADKAGYDDYYEAVLPKLDPHGLIAFDNTLWKGHVAAAGDAEDENTAALRALNAKLRSDPRVVAVMLTVRDGVTLVRKR